MTHHPSCKTHNYPTLSSEEEIKEKLNEIGVDIFEPCSKVEESIALALEEFSNFCLVTHSDSCQHILETSQDGSVGLLQGGNDKYSIYRVSFPEKKNDLYEETKNTLHRTNRMNAAERLLHEFNVYNRHGRNSIILTLDDIQTYMLSMLTRRSLQRKEPMYTQLGNIMFIMQFGGPTMGQVRHIDNMVSNVQVCLYMSKDCPSTTVYVMEECHGLNYKDWKDDDEHEECKDHEMEQKDITNSTLLLQYWEYKYQRCIPKLIRDIFHAESNMPLMSKWYTKYFGYWNSLNDHLYCFGKLYQDVALELGLKTTEPGTVLLAGGNEVHAGPPTFGSRMFAFAIGIPDAGIDGGDDDVSSNKNEMYQNDHDNNGEVQYNPVLLHIDICTLLFGIMDYNKVYHCKDYDQMEAKRFLLDILLWFLQDYPMREYLSQIDEQRVSLLSWMEQILDCIDSESCRNERIQELINEAISSDEIFYTPEIIEKRHKKRHKRKMVKQRVL